MGDEEPVTARGIKGEYATARIAWLGLFGLPLWGGLLLALIWGFVVFKWV